jgi:hypothetical protein
VVHVPLLQLLDFVLAKPCRFCQVGYLQPTAVTLHLHRFNQEGLLEHLMTNG